ncbi:MAG: hypothetical protein ACK4M7_11215, partial [Burkholderiales bacterium]
LNFLKNTHEVSLRFFKKLSDLTLSKALALNPNSSYMTGIKTQLGDVAYPFGYFFNKNWLQANPKPWFIEPD